MVEHLPSTHKAVSFISSLAENAAAAGGGEVGWEEPGTGAEIGT